MRFSLQTIINSQFGITLAKALGRLVPPAIGYPFARMAANWLAGRRNSDMVRAIRVNQWMANGENLTAEQLDDLVHKSFQHVARCQYDLYRTLHNWEAIQRMIVVSPRVEALFEQISSQEKGTFIVGPHLSNFDMLAQAAAMQGSRLLALAVPQPGGGYQMQNDIRRVAGLEIVPASMASMREAARRLKNGGAVITGLDRPIPEPKYQPNFFGRPANLPLHYVSLALMARASIIVAAVIMNQDGLYEVSLSDPIAMERMPDRREEMLCNAERVLSVAEAFINQAPYQWNMYYPVWSGVEQELP